MEGPLSKWTNVVQGWQYRWFVLDLAMGVLSYYTSKDKMVRGDRRGCVKLKNAQMGINDEDDSTFTITVDSKILHFQARDAEERQKWLDALQEARDLHTENYALLQHTNRLLDSAATTSEFDRRIIEADAYLQILIDQHQEIDKKLSISDDLQKNSCESLKTRLQHLIELVKKAIVCLQFAKENPKMAMVNLFGAKFDSTSLRKFPGPSISNNKQFPLLLLQQQKQNLAQQPQYKSKDAKEAQHSHRHKHRNSHHRSSSHTIPLSASSPATVSSFSNTCHVEHSVTPTPTISTPTSTTESESPASSLCSSASPTPPPMTAVVDDLSSADSSFSTTPPVSSALLQGIPVVSYSSSEDDIFYDTRENMTSTSVSPSLSIASRGNHHHVDSRDSMVAMAVVAVIQDPAANENEDEKASPLPTGGNVDCEQQPSRSRSSLDTVDTMAGGCFGRSFRDCISPFSVPRTSEVLSVFTTPATNQIPQKYKKIFTYDPLYDDDDEKDLGSLQSEGSVISYLISQLRIGMDLTRVTLPTFILEKRSTLEMYADFLAHPDLWIVIGDGETPQARLLACLRWYLSAFHASRKTSVCKKPYNPILGEIFRCSYYLGDMEGAAKMASAGHHQHLDDAPVAYSETEMSKHGPIPYASDDCVVFLAEQVSHHPPISAFYAEYIPKRIQVSGHIWTKSKFLGLSIGVEMAGRATVVLLDRPGEEYVVTFPSAYGRNILSVPWVELGGNCTVSCAKTGYSATVTFRTKPFYGGKKDQIRVEAFAPGEKKHFYTVEGEWNGVMVGRWSDDGREELFVNTKVLPITRKLVRPRDKQQPNESRKLWEDVTYNLKSGNIDAATDAKSRMEQRQRNDAAARQEARRKWNPHQFVRLEGDRHDSTDSSSSTSYSYVYKWPLTSRTPPSLTPSVTRKNVAAVFVDAKEALEDGRI